MKPLARKTQKFKVNPLITVFAYGEGDTEEAFLKYIRSTLGKVGTKVTFDNNGGGTPDTIINKVIRRTKGLSYKRIFVLFDMDQLCTQEARNKAKFLNICILESKPCIEGFFLQTLDPNLDILNLSSKKCVELFEKNYLKKHEKTKPESYKKIFSSSKITILKKKHTLLTQIISLMS